MPMGVTAGNFSPRMSVAGKAVVVGAGPCGSVAALILGRHGYDVEVYERRSDPSLSKQVSERSYNLVLSLRGLSLAEQIGIDMSPGQEFPYRGIVIKGPAPSDRASAFFHQPMSLKVNMERDELVRHLNREVQRAAAGSRIKFHWGHNLKSLDMAQRAATFTTAEGEMQQVGWDLLVGADGVNSITRKEVERQVPSFWARKERQNPRIEKYYHHIPPPEAATWTQRPPHCMPAQLRLTQTGPSSITCGPHHVLTISSRSCI
eukprot:jgi/Botrbrau1/4793/Bobra.0325s0015.1